MRIHSNAMVISVQGEVIFDTAKCHRVYIVYNTKEEVVEEVCIESNFLYTDNSVRKWNDEVSYGVCSYYCVPEDLKELADCIKDNKWVCKDMIVEESVKMKILRLMAG